MTQAGNPQRLEELDLAAGSTSRVTATAPADWPPFATPRTSLIDIWVCSTPPMTSPRGGMQEESQHNL